VINFINTRPGSNGSSSIPSTRNTGSNNESEEQKKMKKLMKEYNRSFALHMLIPIYGIVIVVAVLYSTLSDLFS